MHRRFSMRFALSQLFRSAEVVAHTPEAGGNSNTDIYVSKPSCRTLWIGVEMSNTISCASPYLSSATHHKIEIGTGRRMSSNSFWVVVSENQLQMVSNTFEKTGVRKVVLIENFARFRNKKMCVVFWQQRQCRKIGRKA